MSSKNWFLTQNHQIVDLSLYYRFSVDEDKREFYVFGFYYDEKLTKIGTFKELGEAIEYLEKIYAQLWDHEYHPIDEKDE